MKKSTLLILTAGVWLGMETFTAVSNTDGPPGGNTGAPGEGICTDCHSDNAINSGSASTKLTYQFGADEDTLYEPGVDGMAVYLALAESGSEKSGYQMCSLDKKTKQSVGKFNYSIAESERSTAVIGGKTRHYVQHANAKWPNNGGFNATYAWDPPNWNVGPIIFYVAYNGSDGDNSSNGDFIYTKTFEIDHYLGWNVGFNKSMHNDLKYTVYPSTVSDFVNVTYTNPTTQQVSIDLVALDGKKVSTLLRANQAQGEMNQRLDIPTGISSGVYLVRLSAGEQSLTKKIFVN
ncbi:MAG: T9SS type A sorting domain-containing protein [Flavobacteriaceae bacterium]|nr:T9SS type A sorting domain-containing protein [Flavobacteriaceae bacterium]